MPGPGPHYARPADCPDPSRALCCVQLGFSLCPVGQRIVSGETAAPRRDLKGVEEQMPLAERVALQLLGEIGRATPSHLNCMPTRCPCGLEMFRVARADGAGAIAAYCTRCKPATTPGPLPAWWPGKGAGEPPPAVMALLHALHLDLATAEEGNGRVSIRSSEAHALRAGLQALGFQ